jgi:transposase-like protein
MRDPFKYFNSSPEVICLAVMLYVRYPLSLRNLEGQCQSCELYESARQDYLIIDAP